MQISAWLYHSTDPIEGNARKGDTYWRQVAATYNSTTEDGRKRDPKQLKGHWHKNTPKVSAFNAIYILCRDNYESGRSEEMLMEQALEIYRARKGHPFTLQYWWKAVCDSPKWNAHVTLLGHAPTKIAAELDVNAPPVEEHEEQPRPMGIKKAKKLKKAGGFVSEQVKEFLKSMVDAKARSVKESIFWAVQGTFLESQCFSFLATWIGGRHIHDLGIKKMSKSLLEAARLQKSTRASPKPRKKFEVGATEVRRSSRARNSVSYKENFDELDSFLRRRRGSRIRNTEQGRDYTGRVASYEQQQRAFKKAERLQNSLDPENPSFVKTMVRSHVSSCFWLGLPTRFCKLHLPSKEYKMVLEDEEGGEFDSVYIGNRTGLSGGWRGFAMHHNLEDGDSLVFELAEPDRFKIHIVKAVDEDVNESEPADEGADGDKDTSTEDAAEQDDSPNAEPLKGAKRRKLRGRR
uniref:TF-B3 domain-containing protein n=1 Tax=Oryza meridionalis TaxID=40149 RepID=A0A0E0DT43_9ORYZ